MGKKKKKEDVLDTQVVVVEYRVFMHCNACERDVAKIISKYQGVETFTTDMNSHKVVVNGRVDPEKLLKKLKKKTGKRVEILANEKEEEEEEDTCNINQGFVDNINGGINYNLNPRNSAWPRFFGDCEESEVFLFIFSEENPNACSIM